MRGASGGEECAAAFCLGRFRNRGIDRASGLGGEPVGVGPGDFIRSPGHRRRMQRRKTAGAADCRSIDYAPRRPRHSYNWFTYKDFPRARRILIRANFRAAEFSNRACGRIKSARER